MLEAVADFSPACGVSGSALANGPEPPASVGSRGLLGPFKRLLPPLPLPDGFTVVAGIAEWLEAPTSEGELSGK